jgi:hypothetical protein
MCKCRLWEWACLSVGVPVCNQEGRLLLRGHGETGKKKALEIERLFLWVL